MCVPHGYFNPCRLTFVHIVSKLQFLRHRWRMWRSYVERHYCRVFLVSSCGCRVNVAEGMKLETCAFRRHRGLVLLTLMSVIDLRMRGHKLRGRFRRRRSSGGMLTNGGFVRSCLCGDHTNCACHTLNWGSIVVLSVSVSQPPFSFNGGTPKIVFHIPMNPHRWKRL